MWSNFTHAVQESALDVAGFATSAGGAALSTGGHFIAGAGLSVADAITLGQIDSLGDAKDEHFEQMRDGRDDTMAAFSAMCSNTDFFRGSAETDMADWMADLPDDRSITELFLPGTHDTCANSGGDLAECQAWSLSEQLLAGLRVFDIRAKHDGDALPLHHGIVDLQCDFNEVVEVLETFVTEHPKEALFVRIKREGESGEHSQDFNDEVVSRLRDPKLWNRRCPKWKTLGDLRGQITCLAFGSHLKLIRQKIQAQDEYKLGDEEKKFAAISEYATMERDSQTLVVNFCSAVGLEGHVCFKAPGALAFQVNEKVLQAADDFKPAVYMFDFPGNGLIKKYISRNTQ